MSDSHIVYLDTDKELQSSVLAGLEKETLSVMPAESVFEALASLQHKKPVVFVFDVSRLEIPGEELCNLIKGNTELRDIVLFALSDKEHANQKIACLKNGACEFLLKPVDPVELIARITSFAQAVRDLKQPGSEKEQLSEKTQSLFSFLNMDSGVLTSTDPFPTIKPRYGPYRVEELIGSGAMGHVVRCQDEHLDRWVAVKILSKKLSLSTRFVERFRREAKLIASMDHPGIAPIYTFGKQDEDYYFAMQWCQGGSLANFIREKKKVDLGQAIDFTLQAARALSAASTKGIVHRDIKPSNIMLDQYQQIKLVDFGIASMESVSNITQEGLILGTPSFMGPEQAKSSTVDHRADIYSLGITFYFMLFGKLPFSARSAIEMVIQHISTPFPPHDKNSKIPKSVYGIIEKMTQKSPDARYQDYSTLIKDLENASTALLKESNVKIPRLTALSSSDSPLRSRQIVDLLIQLFHSKQSGQIVVHDANVTKRFLVRTGEIVYFESTSSSEKIWEQLVEKKLLYEVPAATEDFEDVLNRLLLNRTLLFDDFKKEYRNLMNSSVLDVLSKASVDATFHAAEVENKPFCTIKIQEVLLEAARLHHYAVAAGKLPDTLRIKKSSAFNEIISSLNLTPEEAFLVSRFEGDQTDLHTLIAMTALSDEKIRHFVYLLYKIEALEVLEREKPKRIEPKPKPVVTPRIIEVKESHPTFDSRTSPISTPEMSPVQDSLLPIEIEEAEEQNQVVRMDQQKTERQKEVELNVKIAEQLYRLAQENYDMGDYWKSANLCKQAAKSNPQESKYYRLMALSYATHPRFRKDAEESFHEAISLAPFDPEIHLQVADFYIRNGLHLRARTHIKKALKITPKNRQANELFKEITDKNLGKGGCWCSRD